eukprot:7363706-Karenia_brevis.AAC.1
MPLRPASATMSVSSRLPAPPRTTAAATADRCRASIDVETPVLASPYVSAAVPPVLKTAAALIAPILRRNF